MQLFIILQFNNIMQHIICYSYFLEAQQAPAVGPLHPGPAARRPRVLLCLVCIYIYRERER